MHNPRRITAALALPAVAAAVATIAMTTGAQAQGGIPTGTLTFTELERGSTFKHVRNTKGAPQQANRHGDQIVFTSRLADAGGAVTGRMHVECVTTTGARDFRKSLMTCSGVMAVRDGTLTLQALVSAGGDATSGAVTGGTGAYAGARGTFTSEARPGGALDTIVLVG